MLVPAFGVELAHVALSDLGTGGLSHGNLTLADILISHSAYYAIIDIPQYCCLYATEWCNGPGTSRIA